MLTPEQQKLFRFLYLYGKSSGFDVMEFEIESNDYLPDEPFGANDFKNARVDGNKWLDLPEKAAQELTDFVNENVFPKLGSTLDKIYDNNEVDNFSSINIQFNFDFNRRDFSADLEASWYGSEESDSETYDLPEDVYNEIFRSVPPGEGFTSWPTDAAVGASIQYMGGGDSGEWGDEIEVVTKDGKTYMLPLGPKTDDWISYNLPSGWEIDEGSSGVVYFDLVDREIRINHTWNTYDTERENILEFEF